MPSKYLPVPVVPTEALDSSSAASRLLATFLNGRKADTIRAYQADLEDFQSFVHAPTLDGRSAHRQGRAHTFTPEEARAAGRKGGMLRGRSSLAKVPAEHRGVRNIQQIQPLTEKMILHWVEEHHRRTAQWPNAKSGEILDLPGESWKSVDANLRLGFRGLPGGSSLAKFIAKQWGVRNRSSIPRLTLNQILMWADSHHRRTGKWPRHNAGPILDAPGETWRAVEWSLIKGARGLPGRSSVARLLAEKRGVRNLMGLPRLEKRKILAWAKSHHQRIGRWPAGYSGPVVDAPGETWRAVEMALFQGLRGLTGRMTLSQLLRRNGLKTRKVS